MCHYGSWTNKKYFDEMFQLILENDVEANQTFLQYSDKILIVYSSM